MTTNSKPAPRKVSEAQMALYRAATISGIYARHGDEVLAAKGLDYQKALRAIRRIANDQANEMARAS
jgi:hypothetical protein